MEIIKNRYGADRTIEKIGHDKIKVSGESLFTRSSANNNGELNMFDFEGGPSFNIGGTIQYQNMNWKIKSIKSVDTNHQNFVQCVLEVQMDY
jgi:hypothetical protein